MITKAEKFWDKQAERFRNSESQSNTNDNDIIARIRKHLSINDNVLDFGCATGAQTIKLAGGVKHIHGLDLSAEMIRYALIKKEESNIENVTFSKGTLSDENFENSSFNVIIASDILHLLDDSEKAIRRIHELLKSKGLFIAATPCMKEKMTFSKRFEVTSILIMHRLGIFPLHLNLYMASDVEKMVSNQGFEIVESEKFFDGITASLIVARKL